MPDLPHTDTLKGPGRVWLDWPGANRGEIVYDEPPERDTQPGQIGYVRADIHAALAARVIEQDAEIERLRIALHAASDPDMIRAALDSVRDMDVTLDDYAKAVSDAIRAALGDRT